jgi:ABC-2 type transport system ATP-binding protein
VLVSTHYMDEAERCHRLAYIAWGSLLASGTAAEIIAGRRLHTWEVAGAGLNGLSAALRALPGVDLVATFGSTLHVSGRDAPALQASLRDFLADTELAMTPMVPSLEDAFIDLMQGTRDPLHA